MATTPSDLLGDSLFQVNLVLWMLQSPNRCSIRPLLAEAGYKLRAIEQELPLAPALLARLTKAKLVAKENASPDVLATTEQAEHLLIECKASMFGATAPEGGNDSNQRQARSFLVQVPEHLSSALAGATVAESHVLYLTREDSKHDQSQGIRELSTELGAAKLPCAPCAVWRLAPHNGGIGLRTAERGDKWPKRVVAVSKRKRDKSVITLIPRDDGGNDLRPLYFIPWMPECEPAPDEYNRRAFGNRILSAAVVKIGRAALESDVTLNYEELLEEATLGVYKRWRNKGARKKLHACVRKLINDHLAKTSALRSDPDGTGQAVVVKISDDKIKSSIIKSFREAIDEKWDRPEEPSLFDKPSANDQDESET